MDLKQILIKLGEHERRLKLLEDKLLAPVILPSMSQQGSLADIVKGKKLKSGQEKIAAIVGFYEKNVQKNPIKEADLRKGWKDGKFDGKFNHNLVTRAIKDHLIRNIDGSFDLPQTGESFFEGLLKGDLWPKKK